MNILIKMLNYQKLNKICKKAIKWKLKINLMSQEIFKKTILLINIKNLRQLIQVKINFKK